MGDVPNSQENPTPDASSGSADFSQDDIDALMSSDADATPSAESAPSSDESSSESPEISQADIDALMGSAGESEDQAKPAPVENDAEPQLDTLGRPFDESAAAMQAAIEEEKAQAAASADAIASAPVPPPPAGSKPFDLPDLDTDSSAEVDPKRITMLNDVKLQVKIELGRTRMLVEEVLALDEGSVVELDKLAGDPVDVYVNERLVARGEVLVLNDSFCVRINDVLSHDPHRVIE